MGSYTYVAKLVANLLAPIALLLVVYGVRTLMPTNDNAHKAFVAAKAFRVGSFVVFLFYPRVSQTIFQGLGCTQLDENESCAGYAFKLTGGRGGYENLIITD